MTRPKKRTLPYVERPPIGDRNKFPQKQVASFFSAHRLDFPFVSILLAHRILLTYKSEPASSRRRRPFDFNAQTFSQLANGKQQLVCVFCFAQQMHYIHYARWHSTKKQV